MNTNKTVLSTAMATALGVSALGVATPSVADSISLSWSGAVTMLGPDGTAERNPDTAGAPWFSGRTAITGTLLYDLDAGAGSATMAGFSFFGGGAMTGTTISLVGIGDGFGNPGSLVLGNMGLNWGGGFGLPFSIVWDAAGLFDTLRGGIPLAPMSVSNVSVSQTIAGVGALAATEGATFGTPTNHYTLPLGPSPMVTTTWNTANIGNPTLGQNPSGTLPLTDDGIGGSPFQQATPFNGGWSMNFDITSMHVDAVVSTVPVPAAVWLFGSGLVGLIGVARRQRNR